MRQRQIEHDERRTTLLESHQRGEPISGDIHIKACKSQRATVHRGAGLVVFDDQNAITNPWFEPYHSVLSSILKEACTTTGVPIDDENQMRKDWARGWAGTCSFTW